MSRHVVINEQTKQGKALIEYIKSLPKNTVDIIENDDELLSIEDAFDEFREHLKVAYTKKISTKKLKKS
jgi:hypothetical protein